MTIPGLEANPRTSQVDASATRRLAERVRQVPIPGNPQSRSPER